jgi:hypothetical protein
LCHAGVRLRRTKHPRAGGLPFQSLPFAKSLPLDPFQTRVRLRGIFQPYPPQDKSLSRTLSRPGGIKGVFLKTTFLVPLSSLFSPLWGTYNSSHLPRPLWERNKKVRGLIVKARAGTMACLSYLIELSYLSPSQFTGRLHVHFQGFRLDHNLIFIPGLLYRDQFVLTTFARPRCPSPPGRHPRAASDSVTMCLPASALSGYADG